MILASNQSLVQNLLDYNNVWTHSLRVHVHVNSIWAQLVQCLHVRRGLVVVRSIKAQLLRDKLHLCSRNTTGQDSSVKI